MLDIAALLKHAVSARASDLHLSSGMRPRIRVDGDLQEIENAPCIDHSSLEKKLISLLNVEQEAIFAARKELDFSAELPELSDSRRFRANIFYQYRGISAAFRIIPQKIPTFSELGLSDVFCKLSSFPYGLILVTGPTGSGKTTTLASMIDYINSAEYSHILTIEDPIEYVFTSNKCLVQQREVKAHTASFADALRYALREDPDYILVGELRDLETIRLALTAAETGHLVFATLHTNSASEAINRVIDVFPSSEKQMVRSILAGSLQAVVSQVLVKKKDGGGRVAVQEIMICDTAIRNMIREDKVHQIYSFLQTGKLKGMRTQEQHLNELREKGVV